MSQLHEMIAGVGDTQQRILDCFEKMQARLDYLENQVDRKSPVKKEKLFLERKKGKKRENDPTCKGKYPKKTMPHRSHIRLLMLKMKTFTVKALVERLLISYGVPEFKRDQFSPSLIASTYTAIHAAQKAGYLVTKVPGRFEISDM